MKILKRIGGVASVPVYLAGMAALGVAGLAVEAWKKRRQRKSGARQSATGKDAGYGRAD